LGKPGADFSYNFSAKKSEEISEKNSPPPKKKCRGKLEFSAEFFFPKIFFPRNSEDRDFPRKKCSKNLATLVTVRTNLVEASAEAAELALEVLAAEDLDVAAVEHELDRVRRRFDLGPML
jgi:hypothetical protein